MPGVVSMIMMQRGGVVCLVGVASQETAESQESRDEWPRDCQETTRIKRLVDK